MAGDVTVLSGGARGVQVAAVSRRHRVWSLLCSSEDLLLFHKKDHVCYTTYVVCHSRHLMEQRAEPDPSRILLDDFRNKAALQNIVRKAHPVLLYFY